MAFDPKQYMTDLRGKDYLEVKWRLLWFRDTYPNGKIETDIVNYAPIVVKAWVYDESGNLLATGHGSANTNNPKVVWAGREIEKAETAAIGRALGHAGFGTQFDPDSDEEDYLADSPVETRQNASQSGAAAPKNGAAAQTPTTPAKTPVERLNSGNGHKSLTDQPPGAPVLKNWAQSFQQLMKRPELIEAISDGKHRANAINEQYNLGKFEGADLADAIWIVIHRNDTQQEQKAS